MDKLNDVFHLRVTKDTKDALAVMPRKSKRILLEKLRGMLEKAAAKEVRP